LKLLLDTHAFLWWLAGDMRLSKKARDAIDADANQTHVSAATAWEITTKHRIGKLDHAAPVATNVRAAIASQSFLELPVTVAHGEHAGALLGEHRDPFDRMLIAQALLENMALVSNEARFDAFAVKRLW
jgi:PIN domain nuclease of toxin-antitoxin system